MLPREKRSRAATVIAGAVMALALPPGAAFAGKVPIEACWSGLEPLVTGRPVKLTLAGGVRIRGRAAAVGQDGLEIVVKKTSDQRAAPKGRRAIPRSRIESISVRKKRSVLGRSILTPVFGLGGAAGAAGLISWELLLAGSGDAAQTAFVLGVGAGTAVLGYLLGSRLDHQWTEIVLLPDADPSCRGQPPGPPARSGAGRGRN